MLSYSLEVSRGYIRLIRQGERPIRRRFAQLGLPPEWEEALELASERDPDEEWALQNAADDSEDDLWWVDPPDPLDPWIEAAIEQASRVYRDLEQILRSLGLLNHEAASVENLGRPVQDVGLHGLQVAAYGGGGVAVPQYPLDVEQVEMVPPIGPDRVVQDAGGASPWIVGGDMAQPGDPGPDRRSPRTMRGCWPGGASPPAEVLPGGLAPMT